MKRTVIITAVVLLTILMIFTFVSRSIYNYSLPQVTAVTVKHGSVELTEKAAGTLTYEGATELKATGAWIVSDVLVEDGKKVFAGDLLCTFDTQPFDINIKALKLNVIRAQNVLEQLEKEFDDYPYQQSIANAEKMLERKDLELEYAEGLLQEAEQTELPQSIVLAVKRRQQDLHEAEEEYGKTQEVLRKAGTDRKDASVIQVIQIAADEAQAAMESAQQALQDALINEEKAKDAVASNITTAKRTVTTAKQAVDDAKALLDAVHMDLSRGLDAHSKPSDNQCMEAAAALDVAQSQLEQAILHAPPSEGITAPCDGIVYGMTMKSGDTVQSGEVIVTIIPKDAQPKLAFTLPTESGAVYGPGSSVQATMETLARNANGTHKQESVKGIVTSGLLNSEGWHCKVELKAMKYQPIAGQDVPLQVSALFPPDGGMGNIIPIGSLFDNGNGGKCVFILETRKGLFGLEHYVMQETVTVIANNGRSVLVSGAIVPGKVIANTPSEAISAGNVVWVRDDT